VYGDEEARRSADAALPDLADVDEAFRILTA